MWPSISPLPPRPSGARPTAARGREVLEQPVDFDEIARAKAEVEVRRPLADAEPAGQLQRGRREPEDRSVETDAPVHDAERASASGRDAETAAHQRSRRARLDVERPAAVGAFETALAPAQGERERGAAGEPRARQPDVAEEALERQVARLEGERHGLGLSSAAGQILDAEQTRGRTAGVSRLRDLGDERLGPRRDGGFEVLDQESLGVDFGSRKMARDAQAAGGRDADLRPDPGVAREAQVRSEDSFDLRDVDVARNHQQDRRVLEGLDGARGVEVAEFADGSEIVDRRAVLRVETEGQVQPEDQGLGLRQLELGLAAGQRARIAVAAERGQLQREILEAAVHPHLPAFELEEASLNDELADPHRQSFLFGRAGQPRRQVPGPVRKLDERDAGAHGAHTSEAQLRSADRDAAADRELRRGEQRLVRDPRVVLDAHVRERQRRRKDPELDAAEAHRPLQQLREALLRDPEHQGLEAVGVPDRVDGEDQEDNDDQEQARRRQALRLVRRGIPVVARVPARHPEFYTPQESLLAS